MAYLYQTIIICYLYYSNLLSRSPTDRTSVEHEQAPGGEEYAVVTTTKKTVAVDSFYQVPCQAHQVQVNILSEPIVIHVCACMAHFILSDVVLLYFFGLFNIFQDPSTIQHEQEAGGDLYAVADKPKKSSKKEKSEDALADMYSVPDKKKKSQVSSLSLPSTLVCVCIRSPIVKFVHINFNDNSAYRVHK